MCVIGRNFAVFREISPYFAENGKISRKSRAEWCGRAKKWTRDGHRTDTHIDENARIDFVLFSDSVKRTATPPTVKTPVLSPDEFLRFRRV